MIIQTTTIQFNLFISVLDNGYMPNYGQALQTKQHMLTTWGKQQITNDDDDN
jgi:hypothetical protein